MTDRLAQSRVPTAKETVAAHAQRSDGNGDGGVPRLALTKAQAAEALGVSMDFFEDHIMLELRIVRRGRRRLIPMTELTRWLETNAERALG